MVWERNEREAVLFILTLRFARFQHGHKAKGDTVEWYEPLFSGHMDKVYLSKVFVFSPEYPWPIDADVIEKGGTGYDVKKCLPPEIDDIQPDLSIYPDVPADTSYGFLTRGCPNKCAWCIVPKKEGAIKPYWDIDRVANGRKKIVLMDNNVIALKDYAIEQMSKAIEHGYQIDFNQAMDARRIDDDLARIIAKVKWIDRRIRFGCDTHAQIAHCDRAMEMIRGYGYSGEFFLYTIIQGDLNECYERISHFRDKLLERRKEGKGVACYPYAQPYRDLTDPHYKPPKWQSDMARWCNMRAIFTAMDFRDYEPRKGFKCSEYFK